VAIQGLAADAKFPAQIGHDGASLTHGSLCEAQFCRRHLRLATAVATTGTRSGKPRDGSLSNQLALELRECREYAKHQIAGRSRGIDRGALAGEDTQSNTARIEVMHDVDEVTEIATKTVELAGKDSSGRALLIFASSRSRVGDFRPISISCLLLFLL
jgi:hypothetical protein